MQTTDSPRKVVIKDGEVPIASKAFTNSGGGFREYASDAHLFITKEGAHALVKEGLMPAECKWFNIKVHYAAPIMFEAQWNLPYEQYQHLNKYMPELLSLGILPSGTREYALEAGPDRAVTLRASWVPTKEQYLRALQILGENLGTKLGPVYGTEKK